MTLRTVRLSFLVLAALLAPLSVHAQAGTRSDEIGRPPDKDEVEIGRYVFAGIGIDQYRNTELWKTLDNAVADVDSMRSTLRTDFGFESPDPWVLRNGQATLVAINQMVDELRRDLQPEDNLIFFFAGHGTEMVDVVAGEEVGRTGYVVPASVSHPLEESPSQYIEIKGLLERLSRLNARHVLVILDSCYSGMALTTEFKSRGGPTTRQADDLMRRQSRRVLTSAQADQLAADGGSAFPENSLFTGWLTAGLRTAAAGGGETSADTDDDGMITATELFGFVSGRVGRASESNQTPDFGAFKYDRSGELVLLLERDPFAESYRAAIEALEGDRLARFEEAAEEALKVREDGPLAAHLRYLTGEVRYLTEESADGANAILSALRELSDFAAAGEEIPLGSFALRKELRKAEKECQRIGCTAMEEDR